MDTERMERAVRTIYRTAAAVYDIMEEDGRELMGRLEQAAAALRQHSGAGEEAEAEYRETLEKIRQGETPKLRVSFHEAEQARDVLYELCDRLEDPKEIMGHVRTAGEMLDVWEPERRMEQEQCQTMA